MSEIERRRRSREPSEDLGGAVPPNTNEDDDIGGTAPPSSESVISRGQDAWVRVKADATFADWLLIGEALLIGRHAAIAEAKANRPTGKKYNTAFGGWLDRHHFHDLDKSDRAKLMKVVEKRTEIEAWRATLTKTERLRLNHPTTVWRRWQADTQVPTAQPATSPRPTLRDTVKNLERENETLQERLVESEAARDLPTDEQRPMTLNGLVGGLLREKDRLTPEEAIEELDVGAKKLTALADWFGKLATARAKADG